MEGSPRIIVIGGSRGGLEAVCEIAHSLPATLPAAVAVVLHTSADSPKLLASIVGAQTKLPVCYAQHDEAIRPARIYMAPPDYHLVVARQCTLGLDGGSKVRFSRPSVDRLFQSAAEVYGRHVIGVVLSGGYSDGTAGLRAIKAAGGITIIQDPAQARDPSMPQSALRAERPDYCIPLRDIGPLLVELMSITSKAGDGVQLGPAIARH